MQELVTDLREVKRLAERRQDENWAFRDWIKGEFDASDQLLMSVVNSLADEITAQVDCTRCANCCREMGASLEDEDVTQLAAALDMAVPLLQQTYLEFEAEDGSWYLPDPCPLLEGNLCRVYAARPAVCRGYPHLHNDFRAAGVSRIRNSFICPIVFNLIEEMKRALCWPRRNRRRR